MKVLFVCCGNSKNFDIAPFIKTQGDSLCKRGIELSYFTINERGMFGYIRYSLKLNKYLKNNDVDINIRIILFLVGRLYLRSPEKNGVIINGFRRLW